MRNSTLSLLTCLLSLVCQSASAQVDYLNEIKPIFTEKCISCHGALKQEGGLRLDTARAIVQGGDSGEIVIAKVPDESELLARVEAEEEYLRMPPEGEGEALSAEQITALKNWIHAGMPAPEDEQGQASPEDHWAYQPIRRPNIPEADTDANSHPIDQFLAAKRSEVGVSTVAPADAFTLLRRVSLDLTGLPPTPEQQQQFQQSFSPEAFESVVNQLLESKHFGERWGRHWMDVWRYSDWDGYKNQLRGSQRHLWHWRDWIIESLNADKGYDQMITEMIAGDELYPEQPDVLRATGFLARNYHVSNRNIWLDSTVEHTAKAFLGLTIACARCHDHKYDPVSQVSYYSMRAIFEPINVRTDRVAGQPDRTQNGIPRIYDKDLEAKTFLFKRGDERQPDESTPIAPDVFNSFEIPFDVAPVSLPVTASVPALIETVEQEDMARAELNVQKTREKLEQFERIEPTLATDDSQKDAPEVPELPQKLEDDHLEASYAARAADWERRSLKARYDAEKARIDDESSEAFKSLARIAAKIERRSDAAQARLKTFRAWRKLQESKKEKAKDALVTELEKAREQERQKLSALSKTDAKFTPVGERYPETSTGRRTALARWITHPDNPLTARVAVNQVWMRHFGTPLVESPSDFGLRAPLPVHAELLDWLASELMESGWSMKHLHRLIVTSDAYQLASAGDEQVLAGNESLDPENQYYWKANVRRLEAEIIRDSMLFVSGQLDESLGGPEIAHGEGEEVFRRSVYFQHAYEKQMLMMTIFDAANPAECYQRSTSIIPQQALALSNSSLTQSASEQLAIKLHSQRPDRDEFINAAFESVLCRPCSEEERDACRGFLEKQESWLKEQSSEAEERGDSAEGENDLADPTLRARQSLVHVLLNHNDFVSVR